jgi:hypothetical protein
MEKRSTKRARTLAEPAPARVVAGAAPPPLAERGLAPPAAPTAALLLAGRVGAAEAGALAARPRAPRSSEAEEARDMEVVVAGAAADAGRGPTRPLDTEPRGGEAPVGGSERGGRPEAAAAAASPRCCCCCCC